MKQHRWRYIFHGGYPLWLSNWELECSNHPFRRGVTLMMLILSHFFFMIFKIVSVAHIFFCFILFVLPLIIKFFMELCPLLFSHNLPINVIDQILISRSCSTKSVLLCRGIRGCCSSLCVLQCRSWGYHSRVGRASSDGCFLIASPGRRIGSID